MDKLATLLAHFSLHADVFYTGNICGIQHFEPSGSGSEVSRGHLHLIRRGPVELASKGAPSITISAPSLIFLPRAGAHRLIADERTGADVVCGTVRFGGGDRNPITDSLPPLVLVELARLPAVGAILALMVEEAFAEQSGRQGVLDRLCEVLVIHLLRHCIDQGLTQGGTLAGLSDHRLAKVLTAIHQDPAKEWSLVAMAELAGMSRARFAVRFRQMTGETPADYLVTWRILNAQRLLRRGISLKHVAYDVGYGSASALIRAFVRKLGCSPIEWLKSTHETPTGQDDEGDDQQSEANGPVHHSR